MASPSVGASNTNRSGISACAPSSCTSVLPVGTSTYPLLAPPPTSSRATSAVSVSPGTSSNAGFSPRYALAAAAARPIRSPKYSVRLELCVVRRQLLWDVLKARLPPSRLRVTPAMVFLLGERDEGFFHHRK